MKSTKGRLTQLRAMLKVRHGQKGHVKNLDAIRNEIKRLEDHHLTIHGSKF